MHYKNTLGTLALFIYQRLNVKFMTTGNTIFSSLQAVDNVYF